MWNVLSSKKKEYFFVILRFWFLIFSIVSVALVCTGSLHAGYEFNKYEPVKVGNEQKCKPKEKKKQIKEDCVADKRIFMHCLKAIVINGDEDAYLPPEHVSTTAKGIELYRISNSLRNQQRNKLKQLLHKYIGKPVTAEKLKQIRMDIQEFFRKNGQPLMVVSIPEQDVTDNVLVIHIMESRVGRLEVNLNGNKTFSKEHYEEIIGLQEDDVIYNQNVEQDVAFFNYTPFRRASVTYSPGAKVGTTDVTYNITDERPFRIYAGADDTGFKVTDIFRVFFGFNWGNFLMMDQILCYQYTASPDFNRFQAHTVHYTLPLPNKNFIILFGGYSSIEAGNEIIPANIHKGQSLQASGRYVYPFMPEGTWTQEVKTGIDYKRTNNDLIVGDTILSSAYATIFQYMASYQASFAWTTQTVDGEIEFFVQPFAIGDSMKSENYDRLRPGAATRYAYIKGNVDYNFHWQKINTDFHFHSTLQASSGTLLPMEELGMGGMNSLRAYPERAVNVDYGAIFNFEVRSPKVSLFHRKAKKPVDAFGAVGFLDVGLGGIIKHVPNEPSFWGLAGLGPGLRYDYSTYLRTRLDMGIRLPSTPFGADSGSRVRLYFSVIGSY